MSQNHLHDTIYSERASNEYARISKILNERNRQLSKSKSHAIKIQQVADDYRHKMRGAVAVCVILILVMMFGGAA